MTLNAGSRLGPYEILSAIGAGGMGEVYRARDTRLERTVAVKVLPAHLTGNEELRQRFEREAKTISQLSHPHICALYDVGREGDADYLVMEFLEGETLASRLNKGALPSEQLLRYGTEIADALDKAHRQGIVHRDLKPGNVMLTKSGVKLLDFGLAKFQAEARADSLSGVSRLATQAQPSQPLTERGTVLGTFQYMAPEQLEGGEADARSDIFAFGAVLYEMATGRKAFSGKSQASLIGAILRDDPPSVNEITPMTPPALNRVIKTCLAKDPEDRFQTAHDVKLQLQWIAEGGSQAGVPMPVAVRRKSRERLAWGVAAAAIVAAALLAAGYLRRAPVKASPIRFEIPTPEGVALIDTPRISPDGKLIAFNASDPAGRSRIWVRPLSALAAQPLTGTEGAARPFWSPDSRFIGFFAEGKLKKIEVSGGPPQKICDSPTGADGTWSPAGVILFDGRIADPIQRVSAEGGTPTVVVKADASRKETVVAWPEFLPDGRHFLYMAQGQKTEDHMYRIGSLDSNESRPLAPAQSLVTYAPPGHLLFVRESTLVAQPFDAKAMKTTGEPVPLAEHIGTISTGLARFSASRNGILAYRTGESGSRFLWVDREGKELSAVGDPGDYSDTMLSPGGDRLAYVVRDTRGGKDDIWVRDLARGASSRFTFDPASDISPLWSPDGKTIVFSSDRGGQYDLYTKAAGGGGQEQPLLRSDEQKFAHSWTRDGRYIAYQSLGKKTGWDLWVLPTFGDKKPILFLQTPFNEQRPAFSPDGKWLAYQSNESGRAEIYVQNFPGPGGKWQVSTAGGVEPSWRADGKELYYGAPDQKLMAVDIRAGETFEAGIPRALFQATVSPIRNVRSHYLPASDGRRFLLLAPLGRDAMVPTTVVVNWNASLSR
ncbi:MAG TPA: protein kinase [Thermoanaerobaculia bacterium]|nr:protein kinase [Thermoanaerobaculia bacterium]